MSVKSRTITNSAGVVLIEERDGDTDAIIRRFRAPEQPLKARLEEQMREGYEDWQRWKNTHAEAVARANPPVVINALLNRTNAAWQDYMQALNEWRQA